MGCTIARGVLVLNKAIMGGFLKANFYKFLSHVLRNRG